MYSMWMYDFHLFYEAGRAVLMGQSLSAIREFIGPYPLAVLFAPLAVLPELLAYALFVALTLFLLWKVMGRRAGWERSPSRYYLPCLLDKSTWFLPW